MLCILFQFYLSYIVKRRWFFAFPTLPKERLSPLVVLLWNSQTEPSVNVRSFSPFSSCSSPTAHFPIRSPWLWTASLSLPPCRWLARLAAKTEVLVRAEESAMDVVWRCARAGHIGYDRSLYNPSTATFPYFHLFLHCPSGCILRTRLRLGNLDKEKGWMGFLVTSVRDFGFGFPFLRGFFFFCRLSKLG